jgi:hypothetical protein
MGPTGPTGPTGATGPPGTVVVAKSGALVQVVNTTTITDLVRVTIPTTAVAGEVYRLDAWGSALNNSGASETPTLTAGLGGFTWAGSPSAMASQASPRTWRFTALVYVVSTNAERVLTEFVLSTTSAPSVFANLGNVANMMQKSRSDLTANLATTGGDLYLRVTFTAANTQLDFTTHGYLFAKVAA